VDKSVDNFGVIHRGWGKPENGKKLSTGYPQVIHRLSTGYPQSYPQAKRLFFALKNQDKSRSCSRKISALIHSYPQVPVDNCG